MQSVTHCISDIDCEVYEGVPCDLVESFASIDSEGRLLLTMTRHGYSHIHVDLQLFCNSFVYCKRVGRFTKQVLAQFVPDQKADSEREEERQEATSTRLRLVCG